MDPQWTGAPPSGSITCMLCRGSVPFSKTETQNFWSHLQHHHGVFYHHQVLISINVLSKNYLNRIVQDYENSGEKSELVGEEDFEEVVELEETVERAPNNVLNFPRKNEIKKESKVHNCKTCNMKFERLGDLIEHVNEHKAEEKRKQDEIEMKKQAIEKERRRVLEEKRVIKQQKEIEKMRLEEEKTKVQLEIENRRQAELLEGKRKLELEGDHSTEGRSREIAQMRATLKQFSESDDIGLVEDTKFGVGITPTPPVVFECQECPYTTKRNIELKLHKLSHTGEKNYECEHCDEKFYLDRHLKRHLLKHTTEFAKKFDIQNTNVENPSQMDAIDTSLPVKPYDETLSQSDGDLSQPKKKAKRPRTESVQDRILSVLSEDSNPEDARLKPRKSIGGRVVSEIAAKSEYFQKFPNQIRRGSPTDESFSEQEPSMPEGWKFREKGKPRPNGRIDREYCSPDFMVFRSKRAMVEYMKTMDRYSMEEIERAEKRN